MPKRRILVLGAGLAGLSTAWHLQRKGIDCHIFEKEHEVGGLCRSKKIGGFTFDYDGHLLHFKHQYTFELVKSLLNNNLVPHQRNAWIYTFDTYVRYPFQANLYGLPASIVKDCLIGFINTLKSHHSKDKNNLNFSAWINQTFGEGIAKHFMLPYNTKFWTIPPKELTCEWLDGFIPVPSLNQLLEGTIEASERKFGYNARFWYPKTGSISSLPISFAEQIKNIHTNCEITEINTARKEIRLSSGIKERFDYVISTIPLPHMQCLAKGLPKNIQSSFKKLRWNSIFNLNLGIEKQEFPDKHWVYFPQKEISFFRVGFFNNFSSSLTPCDKSSLYIEASYSKERPIDKKGLVKRIKNDLERVGIFTVDTRICAQDINDINYGYPIYDKNYSSAREAILEYLYNNNIILAGRYGSWRYLSMEDAILDGKRAADSF